MKHLRFVDSFHIFKTFKIPTSFQQLVLIKRYHVELALNKKTLLHIFPDSQRENRKKWQNVAFK